MISVLAINFVNNVDFVETESSSYWQLNDVCMFGTLNGSSSLDFHRSSELLHFRDVTIDDILCSSYLDYR